MAISTLQQEGLGMSPSFMAQVWAQVKWYALYVDNQNPDLDPNAKQTLAQVIRSPASYGFEKAIIADDSWNLTFDTWAANPPAFDEQPIRAQVQAKFSLLTGFELPPPPAVP
jgi:hypothetical protein